MQALINFLANFWHRTAGNNLKTISGGYKDLGLIVDATNMAAGAYVYSSWIDNAEWVRNSVIFSNADQNYDILCAKRNVAGTASAGGTIKSISTLSAIIDTSFVSANAAMTGGLLGTSAKFGIKNTAASPNTFAKLYVQLLGA